MVPSIFKRTIATLFKREGLKLYRIFRAFSVPSHFHALPRKSGLYLVAWGEVSRPVGRRPEACRASNHDKLNHADFTGDGIIRLAQTGLLRLLSRDIANSFSGISRLMVPPKNFYLLSTGLSVFCSLINDQSSCIGNLYLLVEKGLQLWAMDSPLYDQLQLEALARKKTI